MYFFFHSFLFKFPSLTHNQRKPSIHEDILLNPWLCLKLSESLIAPLCAIYFAIFRKLLCRFDLEQVVFNSFNALVQGDSCVHLNDLSHNRDERLRTAPVLTLDSPTVPLRPLCLGLWVSCVFWRGAEK